MKPDIKKITFLGALLFVALVALQFAFPRIKRLYYPDEKITPIEKSQDNIIEAPTPIQETSPSTQTDTPVLGESKVDTVVKNQTPKTLEVTENEFNAFAKDALAKAKKGANPEISDLSVKIYNGYAQFSLSINNSQSISVNMAVSDDKKTLKAVSYNFSGNTGYTDEIKAQMSSFLTQLFTSYLTRSITNVEIQTITITNTKILIVYI